MRIKTLLLPCVVGSVLVLGCRKTATSSSAAGGSTSTGATSTVTGATVSTGTGTGGAMCAGPAHTVAEVTNGTLGSGTTATLTGVVAMSRKFLVSGKTSCLWGVFVSAPGLTETAENTGVLALSYGTPPMVPAGGTKAYCPEQGVVPAGDQIPDDVAPGDVLDMTGTTSSFPTTFTTCVAPSNPVNSIPMHQFTSVCKVTKTGTATPPKAHLLTAADIANLSNGDGTTQSVVDWHSKWGGVKVRVEMQALQPGTTATSTPSALTDCDGTNTPPCTVRGYGNIVAGNPNVWFGDKMYYRGYQKDVCHSGPNYASFDTALKAGTSETFAYIEGFHYLDFCTWAIEINDRCADVSPPPDDCAAATPPVTSCAGK